MTRDMIFDLDDFYSEKLGVFCHAQVHDNSLILKIDYDGMQFALWKYFEMCGLDTPEALKKSKELYDQILKEGGN